MCFSLIETFKTKNPLDNGKRVCSGSWFNGFPIKPNLALLLTGFHPNPQDSDNLRKGCVKRTQYYPMK